MLITILCHKTRTNKHSKIFNLNIQSQQSNKREVNRLTLLKLKRSSLNLTISQLEPKLNTQLHITITDYTNTIYTITDELSLRRQSTHRLCLQQVVVEA